MIYMPNKGNIWLETKTQTRVSILSQTKMKWCEVDDDLDSSRENLRKVTPWIIECASLPFLF